MKTLIGDIEHWSDWTPIKPERMFVSPDIYEKVIDDLALIPPVVNLTVLGVKIVCMDVHYPWGQFPERIDR